MTFDSKLISAVMLDAQERPQGYLVLGQKA
jgi:hypothetical protein